MNNRFIIFSLILLIFINPTSSAGNSGILVDQTTIQVTIANFAFSPSTITVDANSTIIFTITNNDGAPHTFTALNGDFAVSLGGGESKTITWKAPAVASTIGFVCTIHPSMTGSINVVGPSSSTTPEDTNTLSNGSSTTTSTTPSQSETNVTTTTVSDVDKSITTAAPAFTFIISILTFVIIKFKRH